MFMNIKNNIFKGTIQMSDDNDEEEKVTSFFTAQRTDKLIKANSTYCASHFPPFAKTTSSIDTFSASTFSSIGVNSLLLLIMETN